jgi:hypothetical protein
MQKNNYHQLEQLNLNIFQLRSGYSLTASEIDEKITPYFLILLEMLLQQKHYQILHQLLHLLIVFVPLKKFLIFQMF